MIRIRFNNEEIDILYDIAEEAIANTRFSTLNKDYGDGRHFGNGRIERNVEGFMAEWAFAKHFDVPFMNYEVGADDGNVDLVVNGAKVGVKSTAHKRGHLVVKKRELLKSVVPDYYFFGITNLKSQYVTLVGWIPRKQVVPFSNHRSTKDSYWVPQERLRRFAPVSPLATNQLKG